MKPTAFSEIQNRDYAECLQNAVDFLVPWKYSMNFCSVFLHAFTYVNTGRNRPISIMEKHYVLYEVATKFQLLFIGLLGSKWLCVLTNSLHRHVKYCIWPFLGANLGHTALRRRYIKLCWDNDLCYVDLTIQMKHVKVKQSRYRPGVAQRVPGS